MGLFKVLSFAALGVGAVAAAPFTGGGSILGAATLAGSLAGVGTAAAAVGAAAAGVVAAKVSDEIENDEKEAARRAGHKDGFKEGRIETKKKFVSQYIDSSVRKALFALAMYAANADNYISKEEKDVAMTEIDKIIKDSSSGDGISDEDKKILHGLIEEPPKSFTEVRRYLSYIKSKEQLELAEEILLAVVKADGHIDEAEKAIIKEWEDYYKEKHNN